MSSSHTLAEALREYLRLALSSANQPILITAQDSREYDASRQIFNRKFDFRPAVIAKAGNAEQVSAIVRFARAAPMAARLRVRSGGHDHAGECSGTDVILIDCSPMKEVEKLRELPAGEAEIRIGAGVRFRELKPKLDDWKLGIPHGTCRTVGVTGYTLGGGWGPWTRRYGMGCERLIGATLVLGDGEIVQLRDTDAPDSRNGLLLWALRGGGGMSYGIVTELRYRAFAVPGEAYSFHTALRRDSTLETLRLWEEMIADDRHPEMIGSSLRVSARHLREGEAADVHATLPCVFLGFIEGSREQAIDLVRHYFGDDAADHIVFDEDQDSDGEGWQFDHWDGRLPPQALRLQGLEQVASDNGIELEKEGPAPHKITSRLVAARGWNDEGRAALVRSLQSPFAAPRRQDSQDDDNCDVHTYITLLAIAGPFYADYRRPDPIGSAFPYGDRPYIIQYQAWWDQYLDSDGRVEPQFADRLQRYALRNRYHSNLAEDWIDACRGYPLPGTDGAFISFKDEAVPTAEYFGKHYHQLRQIKREHSRDKDLLFQTAKTII
ncbi:FAD-binding oxidoreductase [Chromobacterium sp. IIBBL 290-4]|uniref:FAD-binding oxidoreductase n=1 Tax=Chromobacterium sp. IIBBL 290-4 TaxID=2953890 RepID=UPI0020B672A1|nr:FAD-dependent oxidoreductase [Chromobacterium sp. IIBBL 290-4]UTH74615.1 FAD-dependent oxidoreductase [Chromobacterium sp. IIBBL 290-4]